MIILTSLWNFRPKPSNKSSSNKNSDNSETLFYNHAIKYVHFMPEMIIDFSFLQFILECQAHDHVAIHLNASCVTDRYREQRNIYVWIFDVVRRILFEFPFYYYNFFLWLITFQTCIRVPSFALTEGSLSAVLLTLQRCIFVVNSREIPKQWVLQRPRLIHTWGRRNIRGNGCYPSWVFLSIAI